MSYRADRDDADPKATQNRANKRRADKHETLVARLGGGQVTRGSGGGLYDKGDVRITGIARIECKATKHASFSVTEAIISKIEDQAIGGGGELPAISVELGSGRRVYVVPEWAMEALLEQARKA